jgi:hypothetical protein
MRYFFMPRHKYRSVGLVWFGLWRVTPLSTIFQLYRESVLLVEKTGVHRENHRPLASHWQTLSHNIVSDRIHEIFQFCQTWPAKFGQILLRNDTRLVFCNGKLMRTDIFFTRTTKLFFKCTSTSLFTDGTFFVLYIKIWTIFMSILYNTLISGGTKDHFRQFKYLILPLIERPSISFLTTGFTKLHIGLVVLFAKEWHKIGILQWKINEDWHFFH